VSCFVSITVEASSFWAHGVQY